MTYYSAANIVVVNAKGDGVTDDTQSFKNAIAKCISKNASLLIPPSGSKYILTETINFGSIKIIDGRGALLSGNIPGSPLIKIANGVDGGYYWINVRNDSAVTDNTNGIDIQSCDNCRFWLGVRGFYNGINFSGNSSSWVSNEFNILSLYNNKKSAVNINLTGSSYFIANQFNGGTYYRSGSVTDDATTFNLSASDDCAISEIVVNNPQIGVSSGCIGVRNSIFVRANLTSAYRSTISFKQARAEIYGSPSNPYYSIYCDNIGNAFGVNVELINEGTELAIALLKVPELKHCAVRFVVSNGTDSDSRTQETMFHDQYPRGVKNGNSIYVADRVLYDPTSGYGSKASAFTTGVYNNSIDVVNGKIYSNQTQSSCGKWFTKSAGQFAYLKILRKSANIVVICKNLDGNILGGNSPYYAMGNTSRYVERGGIDVYEMRTTWVWLHPDVASFYIGEVAWYGTTQFEGLPFTQSYGMGLIEIPVEFS